MMTMMMTPYEQAIDEELVTALIGVVDLRDDLPTAKRKIRQLIDWHVQVATDPRVNGGYKLVPEEES